MPHNHMKMKKIAILLFQMGLFLFAIILLIKTNVPYIMSRISAQGDAAIGFDSGLAIDPLSNVIAIICFLLPIAWTLFDRWLWKTPKINRLLALTKYATPILEGRWVGKLYRGDDERDFVLEIRQTFTRIYCQTYSPTSSSKSKMADFVFSNEQDKVEHLFFLWEGKTSNTSDGVTTNIFYGTTLLQINTTLRQLTGEYFTNRQPTQMLGTLDLKFEQEELCNSFQKQ